MLALLLLGVANLEGQLAVTEAMSYANAACGRFDSNADWWELTNFGTNAIDLSGYRFSDSDKIWPTQAETNVFTSVIIDPGESILFVRSNRGTTNAQAFVEWWGAERLPEDLQILFYPRAHGFDDLGDSVVLGDENGNLIDVARFGETVRGSTFTFDPANGDFGLQSRAGAHGAWVAPCTGDVGSPGYAPHGPVPLSIQKHPESQIRDSCAGVTFTVAVSGLPRPRYQWLHNGTPILDGTSACLSMIDLRPEHAGEYSVVISTPFETVESASATLSILTNPSPIKILVPPSDITVIIGQTATLSVAVEAFPCPSYQWRFGDAVIPDATNSVLSIANAQLSDSGEYRVELMNAVGSTNLAASLLVTEVPRLWITEVMAQSHGSLTNGLGADWWELTNMDSYSINLRGYRWDDGPAELGGGFGFCEPDWRRLDGGGGPRIDSDLIIAPGESIVFVEGMSREEFAHWWGPENLPRALKVVTYTANNLDDQGDVMALWNAHAQVTFDWVAQVAFSTVTTGVSFWFNPSFDCYPGESPEFGVPSVEGRYGAFRAAQQSDIGSPGWYAPRITSIVPAVQGVTLSWRTQPGATYHLYRAMTLNDPVWRLVSSHPASGFTITVTDLEAGGGASCFYRLESDLNLLCDELP